MLLEAEDSEPYMCSARPEEQLQRCRNRHDVGAVHPAGIKEPRRHRGSGSNVRTCGRVGADLP